VLLKTGNCNQPVVALRWLLVALRQRLSPASKAAIHPDGSQPASAIIWSSLSK
jgi:hypothetical protein